MREYSTPSTVEIDATANLTDAIVARANEHPERTTLRRKEGDDWADVTAQAFHAQVRAVAKGLIAAGVEPGDRVALMSNTRYEWTLFDYAIWYAGGASVPIYVNAPADQVSWILEDSGSSAIITESDDRRHELQPGLDAVMNFCIADGAVDRLQADGAKVSDGVLEEHRASAGRDSLATLIYTSGTTSDPKGCMLTHGNFLHEVAVVRRELAELFARQDAATLLFLPLPHVFARVIQIGALSAGVCLSHSAGLASMWPDLRATRPSFLLAVPRVFEALLNRASQEAAADGRARNFDKAVSTAIAYSQALDRGRPGPAVQMRHRFYERSVYAKFRRLLGGECEYVVSGGAPLGHRLGHFFRGAGITILEGYGLTEAAGAVTVNRPESVVIGTVGPPLPGTAVRLADDGELLIKGPQLMAGYWEPSVADRRSFDRDGWLRTGDVAEIGSDGVVTITGRKNELIQTSSGKVVAPEPLEERVRMHPLISQCMVVGDGRPHLGLLVTLDREGVFEWARTRGRDPRHIDVARDVHLRREIHEVVGRANQAVSPAEAIRHIKILDADWSEESGHLTASLKLRRGAVARDFHAAIERLFDTRE